MATITLSVSGSAVVNGTKNYTVSDTDLQSLLDCMKVRLSLSAPTNAQILVAWANEIMRVATVDVTQFKKQTAAQAASDATSGIAIS
jgi:hypothetical protein